MMFMLSMIKDLLGDFDYFLLYILLGLMPFLLVVGYPFLIVLVPCAFLAFESLLVS